MLDGVPPELLSQGGALGVLLLLMTLFGLGRIVGRSTIQDIREDRDARVAKAEAREDEWRTAHRETEATTAALAASVAALTAPVSDLMVIARTTEALLAALPKPEAPVLHALPSRENAQ